MDNLGGALIILGILALVLYFLPTILSLILRRRNTLAIFAMNLLLGWSLIGWVVALVWALSKDNQNQTVIIKNEIKTDSKMVTINKSLDDPHTEKIDDTNNAETSTADKSTIGTVDDSHTEKIDDTNNAETSTTDKSTIGTVENNSNRKKVLNIFLFVSFLWGAFLVGFFVDHYFNRNQSKNTAIVSNQSNSSNSSNSTVVSNQSNSSNSTNSSSTNGSVANENKKIAILENEITAYGYSYKGDYNKAVEYYKKVIELDQKSGYYRGTAIDMLSLGDTYTDLKNFSNAQYYLQKGLSMTQKLGYKYWEATGYKYFGKLYLAQNQESLAREYFTKAYNLFKAIGDNSKAQSVYEKYLK